jgi:hypothetical protein
MLRRDAPRRRVWSMIAAAALVVGSASFVWNNQTQRRCTAYYDGRAVIVGTELTDVGASYSRANPHLSRDQLLFDSVGDAQTIWTRSSIDRCRLAVRATYFLWIPFLIVCLVAAVQAIPGATLSVVLGEAIPRTSSGAPRYDVFLSYRHGGADADAARHLLDNLETEGYTVAIDERDFAANESFLEEMERCVRESRFTVAIVSPRYLESGNCQEEAIVCKVLDMEERRRRLIPFVIEAASMPAWLYGLVGIYCTQADPLVDPIDKLKSTLGPPLTRSAAVPRR